MILSPAQTTGHVVALQKTDPRHLDGSVKHTLKAADPVQGFGELLARTLNGVNQLQLEGAELSRRMITDPNSVDIHDVTIALAEANLALAMTKTIVDKAIQAYRETISIR
jgi:flagellar hook-basal body complex protein FliE